MRWLLSGDDGSKKTKTKSVIPKKNPGTCVSICARGAGTHGDVLNLHTGAFSTYTRSPSLSQHTQTHTQNTTPSQHNTETDRERARKKTEKDRGKKTKEEREETARGGGRGKRKKKKTAFSHAPEWPVHVGATVIAHFPTKKRSLEHILS